MEDDQPISVWNEIRVSGDGIGITLYSESAGSTPVVEDETWFTFDELQGEMIGEIVDLRLSSDSRELLRSDDGGLPTPEEADLGELAAVPNLAEGDRARDLNSPDWSDDDRVEIVSVTDHRADEFVIEGPNWGKVLDPEDQHYLDETVSDANPLYDPDETVVEAFYVDTGTRDDTYAFPRSRLERLAQKEWHDEYGN